MDGLVIRPFYGGDVAHLAVIDLQSYEHNWGEATIKQYSLGIITAALYGSPQGYACIEVQKTQARLLRLAVARNYRRIGIGSKLMEQVLREVNSFKRITTLIPESALPAQCFLRRHSWKCVNSHVPDAFEFCGRKEAGFFFLKVLDD